MPTTFNISDGNLGQLNTTPDMVSALVYHKNFEGTLTGDMFGIYNGTAGLVTSYKEVKTAYDAQSTAHKELWADWIFAVKSFFDVNPNGQLWLIQGLSNEDAPIAFPSTVLSWLDAVLYASDGSIRNIAVIMPEVEYSGTVMVELNTYAANYMATEFCPFELWVEFAKGMDLSVDVRALDCFHCHVCVGYVGDSQNTGMGYILGMKSLRKVHESIGWIEKSRLPIANGTNIELSDGNTIQYMTGTAIENVATKGYTFLRTYRSYPGVYINNPPTCVAITSDFAFSQYVSVIFKAMRLLREYVLPAENSPVEVDSEGKLSENTLAYFRSKASKALEQMRVAGEISAFRDIVVLWDGPTETVTINVAILRINTASYINVNLGFTL